MQEPEASKEAPRKAGLVCVAIGCRVMTFAMFKQ